MIIEVWRQGALGDVIMTTPIFRRLRKENPDATIIARTGFPAVFDGNPDVDHVNPESSRYDRLVYLDLAYENRPSMHAVDAYMVEAFGDTGAGHDKQPWIKFDKKHKFSDKSKYVAVHAARAGWRNRTLPSKTWVEVIEGLQRDGFVPILIGQQTRDDPDPKLPATRFWSTHLPSIASLINSCAVYVGSDTGLLHVAGATDTPIVGVFTSVLPQYRLPYRDTFNYAVVPKLSCVGCQARRPVPSVTESCERKDYACVSDVSSIDILSMIRKAVEVTQTEVY